MIKLLFPYNIYMYLANYMQFKKNLSLITQFEGISTFETRWINGC